MNVWLVIYWKGGFTIKGIYGSEEQAQAHIDSLTGLDEHELLFWTIRRHYVILQDEGDECDDECVCGNCLHHDNYWKDWDLDVMTPDYIYIVHDSDGKVVAPCLSEKVAMDVAEALLHIPLNWRSERGKSYAYTNADVALGIYIKCWDANTWE